MQQRTSKLLVLAAAAIVCAIGVTLVAPGAVPDRSLDLLRAGPGVAGFTLAREPREFEFPRDHGPHPAFRHEWWYLTGNLRSPGGERFGFELTIFRFALAPPPGIRQAGASPPGGPQAGASPWRTRQIYLAHFAVTDVARGTFRFATRLERDALGLAGAQAEPFRVWLDDWQIGGGSTWTVRARQKGYALNLEVERLAAPVLNGDQGLSVKSGDPGSASYYYSIPRVSVRGELVRGHTSVPVSGEAWLDREWGSGSLGAREEGWDWFAVQLDDGTALMFYSLRNVDGRRDAHSAGTWVDSKGIGHSLSSADVSIDVGGHWTNPRGDPYPSRWRLRIPSLALDLDVKPVLANQELATNPRYWEGAVDVSGSRSGKPLAGRGYVELVGYSPAPR